LLKHRDRAILATISAKIGIGDNYLGGWYGYRASKAALNMFMRTTAIEYKRTWLDVVTYILARQIRGYPAHFSAMFLQRNYSRARTVQQLLTVLDQLQESDSGEFFSWDGSRLPW